MAIGLGSLGRLRQVQTRSISAENFDGSPGGGGRATEGTGAACARDLGTGWKISPSVVVQPGETFDLAEIDGAGKITHIWLTTHTDAWRRLVLRAYWDGAERARRGGAVRRLLLQRLGSFRAGELAADRGEPARRLQLLLADAVPDRGPPDHREHLRPAE